METANGKVLAGGEAIAMGLPLAYGGQPCEHVAFIGCHDNLTMFDFVSFFLDLHGAPELWLDRRFAVLVMGMEDCCTCPVSVGL